MRVPIPGFDAHALDHDGSTWTIVNTRSGRPLRGHARPGRAVRFNLRALDGSYANRTLAGWLAHAGIAR